MADSVERFIQVAVMTDIMTPVNKIRWRCRLHADEPALVLPGPSAEIVSYARLEHLLNNACRSLAAIGVASGTVYGLLIKDPLLHLVLSLALEELGAGSMTLYDLKLPTTWPFTAILCDKPVEESSWPVVPVDESWLQGHGGSADDIAKPNRSLDDISRVILTSGSTGVPKGVVFTHRAWDQRLAHFDYIYGELALLRRLMCFVVSAEHRYIVYTLSRGGLYCFADSSIASTAKKIATFKVQYLAAAASTLGNVLATPEADREGFLSLELIRVGGSHLPKKLAEKARETLRARVITSYGAAETGTVAAAWADALDLDGGEVGFVVPGARVDLVDPDTREPVADSVGALRIENAGLATGYFGDTAGRSAFKAGAFYSRDLGSIGSDGRLTIHGRVSNVINLGGDKATIERIEMHYSKAPGIRELAATPVRDTLGLTKLVAVVVPGDEWSEPKFWNYLRSNLPRTFWPVRLIVVQELPRGSGGKVDRATLDALVAG